LSRIKDALGAGRRPLLIAIDGADGVGKSSLASWFAWQLGMPAVHLDLYLIKDTKPLKWRTDEVGRLVQNRIDSGRPIIVEGVFVLDVLDQIHRAAAFIVYVCGEGGHTLSELLDDYRLRRKPMAIAQFSIGGFDEEKV
jgi:2-phosphoglycerate kinase